MINHSSSVTSAPSEIDRVNILETTTELFEATLPQVSIFDRESGPSGAKMAPQKHRDRIARVVVFVIRCTLLALLAQHFSVFSFFSIILVKSGFFNSLLSFLADADADSDGKLCFSFFFFLH